MTRFPDKPFDIFIGELVQFGYFRLYTTWWAEESVKSLPDSSNI